MLRVILFWSKISNITCAIYYDAFATPIKNQDCPKNLKQKPDSKLTKCGPEKHDIVCSFGTTIIAH